MMERPIAYLTRKEVISSCHRLHKYYTIISVHKIFLFDKQEYFSVKT